MIFVPFGNDVVTQEEPGKEIRHLVSTTGSASLKMARIGQIPVHFVLLYFSAVLNRVFTVSCCVNFPWS